MFASRHIIKLLKTELFPPTTFTKEDKIKDCESTRALYSSAKGLPSDAIVDASLGVDNATFIAKTRLAYETFGVCLVKQFFNASETATALRTLKDIIVAPNPQVSSIYFEGSLRQYLQKSSTFEGKTSNEMVGNTITDADQRNLIMELDEEERLRYVRKVMGFSNSRESINMLHVSFHRSTDTNLFIAR